MTADPVDADGADDDADLDRWRGMSGGDPVWPRIDSFLDEPRLTASVERPAPLQLHVGATTVRPGSRVRLHPGPRRTDPQDMFLDGMTATVETIRRDVEDRDCLAVTLEDNPGAELSRWRRRFLTFRPDEVEPLDGSESALDAPGSGA